MNEFHDLKHMVRKTEEQGIDSKQVEVKEEPTDFKVYQSKERASMFPRIGKAHQNCEN